MVSDGPVARLNSVAYPAGDERLMDSVLHMPGGPVSAPFSARGGRRVNGAGLVVSVSGSPEAWNVTPGPGEIYDPAFSAAGGWRFALPSAKSGTMPARPGSGTSRIDYVIARIYDFDVLGSGPRELKIEHIPGTASATPSAPDLTSRPLSLVLATLVVPASGTISVTQSTPRTVAAGGVLPVATTSERDALVAGGIAYPGLVVFNTQTGQIETYNGTDWSGGGWQSWSGTGGGFGAGVTFSGKYQQTGKTVRARGLITTSVNGITGTATWTLPVAPHADYGTGEIAVGSAQLRGGSSANRVGGTVIITGSNVFFEADRATTQTVGAGVPFSWGAGYTIGFSIQYEAA